MAKNLATDLGSDDDVLGRYPSASSPLSIDELMKERAVQGAPPESWAGGFPGAQEEAAVTRRPAMSAAAAPVDQSSPITPASPAAPEPASSFPATEPVPAPAAEPPAGSNEAAMRDLATSGLTQLNTNLTGATQAVGELPVTNPEVEKLDEQIQGRSVPTQLRERLPGDTSAEGEGKILPQFAPSLGRRIWRGAEGALLGLAGGGLPGALVGALKPGAVGSQNYGAPNDLYTREEQAREQDLGNLQDQRKTAFETWKQSVDAAKERASQYRANATLGKDLTTGATDVTKNDIEAAKAANDTPEAKARAKLLEDTDSYNARFGQLDALEKRVGKMPAASEAYFIAQGKMPDAKEPRQPSFEEIALQGLLSRLGHKPTHDEYLAAVREVRETGSGANNGVQTRFDEKAQADVQGKKDAALDKARDAASKQYWTPKAKADYIRDAQAAEDTYEAELRDYGQTPQHMVVNPQTLAFEAGAGAAPAGAPAQAQNQPPAGAVGKVKGSDGKMHWTDKAQGGRDLGVAE